MFVVRCSTDAYLTRGRDSEDKAMTQYGNTIARVMNAGIDAWRVSLQIAETMAASQTVITARMTMLGAGLEHPSRLPVAEFSRLVPEKATAFGKANAGVVRSLGTSSAKTPDGLLLLDWWEATIRATAAWWKPVHAQAMANARRLG